MATLNSVLPHLFPPTHQQIQSPQSSLCSLSPCYHPGPVHHHLPPGLLLWPPKWTPCFCSCLYSLITAQEPERSFHNISQTMICLCLEFPEAPFSCRIQLKALTLAYKALHAVFPVDVSGNTSVEPGGCIIWLFIYCFKSPHVASP